MRMIAAASKKIHSGRLRIANRGSMLLKIFLVSMLASFAFSIPAMTGAFASEGIPASLTEMSSISIGKTSMVLM